MPVPQVRAKRLIRHGPAQAPITLPYGYQFISQGFETDPETEQLYLQAFVYSGKTRKSDAAWDKAFPDCAKETIEGVFIANAEYEGTRGTYTLEGDEPMHSGQKRVKRVLKGHDQLILELPDLLGPHDFEVHILVHDALRRKEASLKHSRRAPRANDIRDAIIKEFHAVLQAGVQHSKEYAKVCCTLGAYSKALREYDQMPPPAAGMYDMCVCCSMCVAAATPWHRPSERD